MSLLTIGGAWLGHTALTARLASADSVLLRVNLLFLMAVSFLPFPTRLVAGAVERGDGERVFVTMYGLTLLAIRVLLLALDAYARREGLFAQDRVDGETSDRRHVVAVIVAYCVAILVGLGVPELAVALYCALGIVVVVPWRELARLVR